MRVEIRTGTEGPKHDPYGYEEITAIYHGQTVTLHIGLANWVSVDGRRIHEGDDAKKVFTNLVGWCGYGLVRWHERANARCRTCGMREHHSESGYPGETFTVCKNGHLMNCSFNESAVL